MATFKKLLAFLLTIGSSDSDDDALRLKKSSILLVPLIIAPLAIIWGSVYMFLGQYYSGFIPLSYAIISLFNLIHFHKTKNIIPLQKIQLTLVLILPFLLMYTLGGFASGSYVMVWAFFAPVAALMYEQSQKALYWFYSFILLVVISVLIDEYLMQSNLNVMPQAAIELFNLLNISAGFSGLYFLFKYFISEREKRTDNILQKEHEALLRTTKKLEEVNLELEDLAHFDTLTKIANRYYFLETLSKTLSFAKRTQHNIALLNIDLDGFKAVNDNYGHAVGDDVLKSVASRMKALLREEDMVARIGGDEFAIILNVQNNIDDVKEIAQRIIDKVNLDYEGISEKSPIGASIGICLYPRDAVDVETLINYADKAMYSVKKSSKNSYAFYDKDSVSQ